LAKIFNNIKDPNFYRDLNGKLDGVLFKEEVLVFSPFIPRISPIDFISLVRKTLKPWAAHCTTTVFDTGISLTSGWREIALIKTILNDSLLHRFGGALTI